MYVVNPHQIEQFVAASEDEARLDHTHSQSEGSSCIYSLPIRDHADCTNQTWF